jgi:hypothetical protein
VSYPGEAVGADIGRQLDRQLGETGVRVTCPDIVGHPGDVFTCTARDRTGGAEVRVTLSGSSYTWQLVGA